MNSFRRGEASIRGDLGRASVLGLIVTLSLPPALAAQSVTLRLGGFRMSYDDSLKATAAAVAAEGLWSWRTARAGLAGSLATFDGGGWAGQGTASAARALLGGGRRALYAAGDATGYGFEGGYWAGTASAGLAGATALGPFGATLYLAGGGVRRIAGGDDPLVQATLRVQRNARCFRLCNVDDNNVSELSLRDRSRDCRANVSRTTDDRHFPIHECTPLGQIPFITRRSSWQRPQFLWKTLWKSARQRRVTLVFPNKSADCTIHGALQGRQAKYHIRSGERSTLVHQNVPSNIHTFFPGWISHAHYRCRRSPKDRTPTA